ncbi:hypothetical protein BJV82DRAFT_675202 [Fennellomyces sp. T-0311]|nr:hypothetical protein BJV82DRAFT_675202 [Fennellomyces sp. T-0311]
MSSIFSSRSWIKPEILKYFEETTVPYRPKTMAFSECEKYFQEREYEKVLTRAASGIKMVFEDELTILLDYRIRARAAIGNYGESLPDAKQIYKNAPNFYYGYVRTAQIQLIEEDYKGAFKTFAKAHKYMGRREFVPDRTQMERLIKAEKKVFEFVDQITMELVKWADYKGSLAVARHIIKAYPRLATGYLRAAQAYYAMDNHKQAIKVLDKGLAAVPKDYDNKQIYDPEQVFTEHIWESLEEYKSYITKERRYQPADDIFMRLPDHILCTILRCLDTENRINLLQISFGWFRRLKELPDAWRVLCIDSVWSARIGMLGRAALFVRKIRIELCDESIMYPVLDAIAKGRFKYLNALELYHVPPPIDHSLIAAFQSVRLTHFKIELSGHDVDPRIIPLATILDCCPELTHVVYIHDKKIPSLFPDDHEDLMVQRTKVTSLVLGNFLSKDAIDQVRHICYCCPRLENLRMYHCKRIDLLNPMLKWPNLLSIAYDTTNSDECKVQDGVKGIRFASIVETYSRNIPDDTNTRDLISNIVCENWDTLETLRVGWPEQSVSSFPIKVPKSNSDGNWTLKKLAFSNSNISEAHLWFEAFRVLQEVTLSNCKSKSSGIFLGLAHLDTLHRLEILKCDLDESTYSFNCFLAELADRDHVPQLHTLIVHFYSGADDTTLQEMVRLKSLRSVTIKGCENVTALGFKNLARLTEKASQLEELVLGELDIVRYQVLMFVRNIFPKLKTLELNKLKYLGTAAVRMFIEASPGTNLTTLKLIDCRSVEKMGISASSSPLHIYYSR